MIATACGREVERDALPRDVERPEKAGRVWQGIPHYDLAHGVVGALERRGVEVVKDTWALDKNPARMVGAIQVRAPGLDELPGMDYALAVMTSNDMTRSLRIAAGAEVFVCNNGVMTGEFVVNRKHTTGVNVRELLRYGVDGALQELNKTQVTIQGLRDRTLNPAQVDAAFMEMGRRGVLAWSGIGKAWKEYKTPEHREFRAWKGTSWGVYQAVNHVIKTVNPLRQLPALRGCTEVLRAA
ncbi:MAG: DUF932 domain-containing protein [Planctomycetota bacterium]|jgi:hypothetical protein